MGADEPRRVFSDGDILRLRALALNGRTAEAWSRWPEISLLSGVRRGDKSSVFQGLISGANADAREDAEAPGVEGMTALMLAGAAGSGNCVSMLLLCGADAKVRGPDGWTALMLACESGIEMSGEGMEGLLAASDAGAENERGERAWTLAAKSGSTGWLKALKEAGAWDVKSRDGRGNTALILAAGAELRGLGDGFGAVSWLLDEGSDVEAANDTGDGALMAALRKSGRQPAAWLTGNGFLRVLDLLSSRGGNLLKNKEGESAADVAEMDMGAGSPQCGLLRAREEMEGLAKGCKEGGLPPQTERRLARGI